MRRLLPLAVLLLVGCNQSDSGTPVSEAPKAPTPEQLAKMPEQARSHASEMGEYAKGQQEQMAKSYKGQR